MSFPLAPEQAMLVDSVRAFVEKELYPHEDLVENLDDVPADLAREIQLKALNAGFYAANMPAELGGGGLDALSLALMERELGRAGYALQMCVWRPSNILRGCRGEQIERYLIPTIRGERHDCLAMSEPGAGSDVRAMKTRATRKGDGYALDGSKHFISHADKADYVILFAATGPQERVGRMRSKISAFLVDVGAPGFTLRQGPACVGRAQRVLESALDWAATRVQFGEKIGRFQGVSFQLADMATEIEASNLLTLSAAHKVDQGAASDQDFAMAKLFASETLARVTDRALQIYGGMGLMASMPLERWWRDARVERIWDGTSEIQRHIISRALLRPLGC